MNQRRIVGIDPGINGACALYLPDSTVPTAAGGLFDIPTTGESKQREIDYGRLRDLVFALRPTAVVIEIVNAFMPSQRGRKKGEEGEEADWGNTSLFRFGGSYFSIHAVVACLDLPRHRVSSAGWKNHFGLKGKPKGGGIDDSARQVVLRRWPALQPFLTRKGDQHRAEAFLIAVHHAETFGQPKVSVPRKRKAADVVGEAAGRLLNERPEADDIPE